MKKVITFLILFFVLVLVVPVSADDYDDGIGEGDGIKTGDNDLQKVTNIKFYNAKVRAKTYKVRKQKNSGDGSVGTGNGDGGVNIASPTINGPVHGDVIIQMDAKDINILQGK